MFAIKRVFALFETPIGACGIAWGERGVSGVWLPAASASALRARMRRRYAGAREEAPPPEIARAIEDISALLRGERIDLAGIALDLGALPEFEQRVYAEARRIPAGSTLTYGELAARIGDPGAARDVGQALGRNPFPIVVPCHRIVAAGGKLGGFSAPGGADTKLRLLAIEGALSQPPLPFPGSAD